MSRHRRRRALRGTLVILGTSAICASSADAARLRITSTAKEAVAGRAIPLTVSGNAKQDGSYALYVQPVNRRCGRTAGQENQGQGGGPIGRLFAGRQNIAQGERFSDQHSYTPTSNDGVRFCGYLGDHNENGDKRPDARAQLVICGPGTVRRGTSCGKPGPNQNNAANRGECADHDGFTRVRVYNMDCAAASRVQRAWLSTADCRPTADRRVQRCMVLGGSFRCLARRTTSGRLSGSCRNRSTGGRVYFRRQA